MAPRYKNIFIMLFFTFFLSTFFLVICHFYPMQGRAESWRAPIEASSPGHSYYFPEPWLLCMDPKKRESNQQSLLDNAPTLCIERVKSSTTIFPRFLLPPHLLPLSLYLSPKLNQPFMCVSPPVHIAALSTEFSSLS